MVFRALLGPIAKLFNLRSRVDKQFLEDLEKHLQFADDGSGAAQVIVERMRQAFQGKEISNEVIDFLKQQLIEWESTGPNCNI
jgi:hypothetical protein